MTLAELTNLIVVTVFGANYLFFLFAMIVLVMAVMFFFQWSGAEALIAGILFSYVFFAEQINPLFTSIFAIVMLAVAVMVIFVIWRHFANG